MLVVWKAGIAFELLEIPTISGVPPAPVDIRTALNVEESVYEGARRLAAKGAAIA